MGPVLLTRSRPDTPWGFRLHGGTDQQKPLTVQRVTPGSVAAQGLLIGDKILRIGNTDATTLSYATTMEMIKSCGDRLELYTDRSVASQPNEECSNFALLPPLYTANDTGRPSPGSNGPDPDPGQFPGQSQSDDRPGNDVIDRDAARPSRLHQQTARTHAPEAVLNMAARTTQDKRPWTYAPDMQSIQMQRRRIQRRNYGPMTDPAQSPQVQRSRPLHQPIAQAHDGELGNGDENVYKPIYGGPEIPSKTFQVLQSFTSNNNESENADLERAAQRRQKRREKHQYVRSVSTDGHGKAVEPEFDESAYLAGQVPVLGQKSATQASTPVYQNSRLGLDEEDEEERNDQKPFDERAYLAGRIPLVKGGPIDPTLFDLPLSSGSNGRPEGREDEDEREDENKKPFDERAYLAGRIPLVKGGEIDPSQFNVPERRVVRKYKGLDRPRLKQPFDERSYLTGKLNIMGQPADRPRNVAPCGGVRMADVKPSWYKKDEDMVSEDEYDEDSFLKGKFSIVRRSVDRELPPRQGVLDRSRYGHDQKASWERKNREEEEEEDETGRGGTRSETEFDERAYLAGVSASGKRLITDKEYSTDTEVADVPSKTLRILRRSVSRERSADEYAGWSSSNEDGWSGCESDQEKPYDYYMYQGRNIPSRSFSRLKKTMDRKEAAEKSKIRPSDPIERLKEKSLENLGIDVDTAMERLEIGKHDPDTYMEILKKSVEENQNNIRIEPENEVTDF